MRDAPQVLSLAWRDRSNGIKVAYSRSIDPRCSENTSFRLEFDGNNITHFRYNHEVGEFQEWYPGSPNFEDGSWKKFNDFPSFWRDQACWNSRCRIGEIVMREFGKMLTR